MIHQKIYKLAISLGFLPLCAYAEMCCPLVPGDPIEDQVCPGYYYPALYDTSDCLDISVTADFIYWAPQKQLNSYAIENNIDGAEFHMHVISHRFGYRPGLKVGAGLGLPCFDNIVVNAEYFWFNHATTSSKTASPGDFITPLPGISQNAPAPQPISSSVTSNWRVNIQMAQLTFGRPHYIGQRIILSPWLGLKAVWSHQIQAIDFDLIAGGIGRERNSFKFWAIGPYLSVDAKGLLCGGLYAVGKMGMIVLYQRYTEDNFTTDIPFANPFQVDFFIDGKKPYAFPTYLESGFGVGWGKYFGCQKYHVDLAITYDYFIAMYLIHAVFGGNLVRDFYMHGLRVKGQFVF